MKKEVLQKIKTVLSVTISIIFWIMVVCYAVRLIYMYLELPSFNGTKLAATMELQQQITAYLLLICLLSVWVNKKLLMIIWIIAIYQIDGVYTIIPEYKLYLEKEICFDSGRVWDYNEKRCRSDCIKWDKEHGCYKD